MWLIITTIYGVVILVSALATIIYVVGQTQQTIDKLTDKIMSKDYKEYVEMTQPIQMHSPVIWTDQAEYEREIEDSKSGL